jgi:DNA-binding XRE family transcriptional regulator
MALPRRNNMREAVQYLSSAYGKRRLVVMSEKYFNYLLQNSSKSKFSVDTKDQLPFEVTQRIDRGESALTVLRTWRGFTGKDLAGLIGVSQSMVSQMEKNGKMGSAKTLRRLAHSLDISVDLLIHLV